MKKLHSNGYSLIQTNNTLYFASISEKGNQTIYFKYDGEHVEEISKDAYVKSNFGEKWKKVFSQLSNSNFSSIESIAKCWINEDGESKLISLIQYYTEKFGDDWESNFDFKLIPKNLFSEVTNFMTCTIQNETICLIWPHDIILHFNEQDELVQYILLESNDCCDTLYQICSDGQSVWGVSPTMNSVVKYTFPSFKIEKIYHYTTDGDDTWKQSELDERVEVIVSNSEIAGLNYPEYISYIDGQLYICDMANERIVTLNPINGKVTPYISLNANPFEFLKWKNQFVIRLDTGLYLLETNEKNGYFE